MPRYRITEWDQRYEVDDHGGVWTPGDTKRAGPLTYIRHKVHGRSQGIGWRKLIRAAGIRKAPAVFGIFGKLLEVAGDSQCENRGFFQDDTECPLFFMIGLDKRDIKFAISVLLAIGWIEVIEEDSRNSRDSPEFRGIPNQISPDQFIPPIVPQGTQMDLPPQLSKEAGMQNLDLARKLWPGVKRGIEVEFENFAKKNDRRGDPNRDWRMMLDDDGIAGLVQVMIDRKAYSPGFWPHFSKFVNQRLWETAMEPVGRHV